MNWVEKQEHYNNVVVPLLEIVDIAPNFKDITIPNGMTHIAVIKMGDGTMKSTIFLGYQWDMCYWIWRLATDEEEESEFSEFLSEFILSLINHTE